VVVSILGSDLTSFSTICLSACAARHADAFVGYSFVVPIFFERPRPLSQKKKFQVSQGREQAKRVETGVIWCRFRDQKGNSGLKGGWRYELW